MAIAPCAGGFAWELFSALGGCKTPIDEGPIGASSERGVEGIDGLKGHESPGFSLGLFF
jgi:hypothetical protein